MDTDNRNRSAVDRAGSRVRAGVLWAELGRGKDKEKREMKKGTLTAEPHKDTPKPRQTARIAIASKKEVIISMLAEERDGKEYPFWELCRRLVSIPSDYDKSVIITLDDRNLVKFEGVKICRDHGTIRAICEWRKL
jgi:hypothetical protein